MEISKWEAKVFSATQSGFSELALNVFREQYAYNDVYKKYIDTLGVNVARVDTIEDIPFLPVQFFKTNAIKTTPFEAEVIFESSGTTGKDTSRHYVKDVGIYTKSFTEGFNLFYGEPAKWCILALLPGYTERQNSSLVAMTDSLIKNSGNPYSGYYLRDHEKLYRTLMHNESKKQPVLLIGVTFALLDFAEKYSMKLRYTTIMETGGMKGRREEITREEIHGILRDKLGVEHIHSEYGMTELLSQAYSRQRGLFECPPWMKILIREENDPLSIKGNPETQIPVSGLLNIIDLANLYSCSFIATDDVGKLHKNGDFEVLGRRDMSDIRGCSLLTASDY